MLDVAVATVQGPGTWNYCYKTRQNTLGSGSWNGKGKLGSGSWSGEGKSIFNFIRARYSVYPLSCHHMVLYGSISSYIYIDTYTQWNKSPRSS